jgi:hypothetical protein
MDDGDIVRYRLEKPWKIEAGTRKLIWVRLRNWSDSRATWPAYWMFRPIVKSDHRGRR